MVLFIVRPYNVASSPDTDPPKQHAKPTSPDDFCPAAIRRWCVEFGDRIDRHVSALVLALARQLEAAALPGVVELVPTFRSLMVHYDPSALPQTELQARLAPLIEGSRPRKASGRRWRIPACYDESLAPDLAEVAERTRLTQHEVVERHSARDVSRLHDGLPAGLSLHGRPAAGARAAAPREPAHPGAAGFRSPSPRP